jgi:hypothetical protein
LDKNVRIDTILAKDVSELRGDANVVVVFGPDVEVVFFDEFSDDLGLCHVGDVETEDLVAVEGLF